MDVQVGFALLDHRRDLRRGEAAGRGDVPDVAAVRGPKLRMEGIGVVDVEDDLRARIDMDVIRRPRGGEAVVVEMQDALSAVGVEA
jgi:hypothetical protein